MSNNRTRTALVTGANSGLGFEAAAQLAETGYRKVTITARTPEKASTARDELTTRTGRDIFETLVLDNALPDTIEAAAAELIERDDQIDVLLLNAGIAPTPKVAHTPDGIETTVASTLTGHHLLTVRLLEAGLLSEHARIVIAGSEAARGDVPMMNPVDLPEFASEHFEGNLEAAIEAQVRMESPAKYKSGDVYATAKMFVAWWAAELARKLPDGMTVTAVSPGSAPDTNAVRNAPLYMRRVMIPLFKVMPARMAMAGTVAEAANRYVQAAHFDTDASGKFFASKPKKMVGELVEVDLAHIEDRAGQEALWSVVENVTNGASYPARV
jgi:NAD(P)-dependent dehydrogenase (short-subunit alcohol dehydrogenase family)